jgi:hypothetical protein
MMRTGYRLAVRRHESRLHGGREVHSCLLYATDLTRRPPYRRLRWRMIRVLLELGVLEKVRTIGGNEDYYRLAAHWVDAPIGSMGKR